MYFGLLCCSIVYFDVVGCLSVSEINLFDFDVLNALVDMTMLFVVYVSSLLFPVRPRRSVATTFRPGSRMVSIIRVDRKIANLSGSRFNI